MKRILLIATGGTIACSEGKDGLTPLLTCEKLLSYVEDVDHMCNLDAEQLLNVDSTNMQPENWIEMVRCIEKNYSLYDGFVITHGTDTMAYTSAALSYMIQNPNKPIVITGAQKPMEEEETDARRNLKDAIRFSCEDVGGIFVVFDGKAINGARAEKVRTKSYNAFESINFPYAAIIRQDRILYNKSLYNDQIRTKEINKKTEFYTSICTDIFLLKLTPGIDEEIFDYFKERYAGIIIESYGSGGIPSEGRRNLLNKIKEMTDENKVVVVTTQVLLEGSDLSVYEVGRKVLANNIIPAHDMTTEAIVTKLMWAMGQTKNPKVVKDLFLTPIGGDLIHDRCFIYKSNIFKL